MYIMCIPLKSLLVASRPRKPHRSRWLHSLMSKYTTTTTKRYTHTARRIYAKATPYTDLKCAYRTDQNCLNQRDTAHDPAKWTSIHIIQRSIMYTIHTQPTKFGVYSRMWYDCKCALHAPSQRIHACVCVNVCICTIIQPAVAVFFPSLASHFLLNIQP